MSDLIYEAKNETETAALGAALAEVLPPGATVALSGTLGAGKTRLAQAIAEALGIERGNVVSPTFVLAQEYHGRRTLYHIDAYRLRDEDEFLALGPEEYFESDGITLLEWADRVANCLPREYLSIDIEVVGEDSRRFKIAAVGPRYAAVVDQLQKQYSTFE
jgi:tRNA threonylcarbamoyladenosine biosynthesis protein TsaE